MCAAFFLLLLLGLFLSRACGSLISQTWRISYKFVSPDGVEKLVPVVNGQYPGPAVRGRAGDTVRITVNNALPTDTTSIHWHGIKQLGTPWSDGVPGVTQCALGPDQTAVYTFALDKPGTLWWHSHSGFQKSSLYGSIVVEGDEHLVGRFPEINLLLNDWYHETAAVQIAGLLSKPFRWVGDAQSLLFNGRGVFDCEKTTKVCNPDAPDAGPAVFDVLPGTVYRLRIVGASSLSFMNFGIDKHPLEVVEVETTLVRTFQTNWLDVAPGQSFSVLLKTKTEKQLKQINRNNGLFWIQTNVRHRDSGPRGLAILRYVTASENITEPIRRPPTPPDRHDVKWSLKHARRFRALVPMELPPSSRTLVYLGTQNIASDGKVKWALNNVSFEFQPTPVLHSMALEVESETSQWLEVTDIPNKFDYNLTLSEVGISSLTQIGTQVVKVEKNEVVDFVFQNTKALNGADEVHPWHLHLHNFWVLAFGEFAQPWTERSVSRYDTLTAVSRNTFSLLPGGWTAIRVKFDNPGAAHFHCHILAHLAMGMGFVVQIGDAADVPPAPPGTQFCGKVTERTGLAV